MAEYVDFKTPKGPKLYKIGKFSFSNVEFMHLSLAFVMLGLTLFVRNLDVIGSVAIFNQIASLVSSSQFVLDFSAFILAFGLGFILHEFAHKLVAQHYGFISEFRADIFMLFAMFIMALFLPIIFLAPGAVMIMAHRISIKQNGIISVAGPVVNLGLAIIGVFLSFIFTTGFMSVFSSYLIWINAYLGIFNMLPFWVLDGKKVLAWDKKVYFTVMLSLIGILIFF